MSDRTFHVNLSVGGVNQLIRQLERYQQRLDERTGRIVDELVAGGAEMARFAFHSTARVETISENGTGIIEAVGENVIIMEFGAGLSTMESHPMAPRAPVPIRIGSYSRMNHGQFWDMYQNDPESAYWVFGGRHYQRVEPRHGLLDARDYIVTNLMTRARSVFND